MKKLALSLASAAVLTTAATAAPNFGGFNIGLQVGAATSSNKAERNLNDISQNNPGTVNQNKADLATKGAIGGVHAGWDKVFQNRWLAGVAVFVDASGLSGTANNTINDTAVQQNNLTHNSKARMKYSVGAGVNLGVIFDNALAYVNVGWVGSDWKVSGTMNIAPAVANVPVFGQPMSVSNSKFVSGFRAAFGTSMMVADNVKLGAELGYTWYGKVEAKKTQVATGNSVAGAPVINANDPYTYSVKAKPEVLDCKVKLSWQINKNAA